MKGTKQTKGSNRHEQPTKPPTKHILQITKKNLSPKPPKEAPRANANEDSNFIVSRECPCNKEHL
jgi:hypothetical protein